MKTSLLPALLIASSLVSTDAADYDTALDIPPYEIAGGDFYDQAFVRDGHQLSLSGGTINTVLSVEGSGSVIQTAGNVGFQTRLNGGSSLRMEGGTQRSIDLYDTASLEFSGTSTFVAAYGQNSLSFTGGNISQDLDVWNGSVAEIDLPNDFRRILNISALGPIAGGTEQGVINFKSGIIGIPAASGGIFNMFGGTTLSQLDAFSGTINWHDGRVGDFVSGTQPHFRLYGDGIVNIYADSFGSLSPGSYTQADMVPSPNTPGMFYLQVEVERGPGLVSQLVNIDMDELATGSVNLLPIPEPATYALLLGLFAIAAIALRRSS